MYWLPMKYFLVDRIINVIAFINVFWLYTGASRQRLQPSDYSRVFVYTTLLPLRTSIKVIFSVVDRTWKIETNDSTQCNLRMLLATNT